MKRTKLILLLLLCTQHAFGQLQHPFSPEEVHKDLKTLRESLEESHYNLYAYTTEQAFDSTYLAIKNSIGKDSLGLLETTNLFQRLISTINNGHTEIDFPIESYVEYVYSSGTLFPLELAFEDGMALIRKNWSDQETLHLGTEVLRINGMPISRILEKIYPQLSAERPYFKNAKLELYSFPRCFWQVFGEQAVFEVEVLSEGVHKTWTLKAIDAVQGYETKRYEVLNAKKMLKFHVRSAYLNPGNFSGDEPTYRQFIDSAFTKIRERKSENLIIDLRNNGGGDDSFSDYLVAYLADKPFRWNSSFTLKTSRLLKEHVRQNYDTTATFWQQVLAHKDGEIYDYPFEARLPQPVEKRFHGEVYVLVNRQSHSQSAVTAAQIQDYGFGTIVGEETGDFPSLYASQFQYELPITKIPVKVSKGYIVRVNGSRASQGVRPDIFIQDHLLDEKDEILTGLLQRINTME